MLSSDNFERLKGRAVAIAAGILHAYSAESGRKQPTSVREAAAAARDCVRTCALVAPALPHLRERLLPVMRPLSLIDLELMSHCYDIDWSLVFTEGIDVPLLRDALSHALGAFPSLAGRVVSSSLKGSTPAVLARQPKDVALCVGGERDGVWLSVLDIPLPLPRFISERKPELLKGLISDEDVAMFVHKVNRDMPVAHFTVLQFEGAGVLNMRISHCTVDGTAFGDFVAHLAACYTHLTARSPPQKPAVKPCEDRIAFDVSSGLPFESAVRKYEPSGLGAALCEDFFRYCVCDTKSVAEKRFITSPLGGICGYMTLGQVVRLLLRGLTDPTTGLCAHGPTHMVRMTFSHAELKRLKSEAIRAAASTAGGVDARAAAERLSTNDALGGLLWKAVEMNRKSRGLFDFSTTTRTFFMPVNIRGRLSPPTPDVFGNGVVLTVAKLDVKEFADRSVGEIALKLRAAKANITPETIRDEVNFVWDNVSNGRYLRWSMDTFTGGLLVSDWTKFRFVTEADGKFGKETPIFDPSLAGGFRMPYFAIIYETHDRDGLVVDISVPDDERSAFLQTIAQHASPRGVK